MDSVAAMIGRCVHKHGQQRGVTLAQAKYGLAPARRSEFAQATAHAVGQKWIVLHEGRLFPGPSRPPGRGAQDLGAEVEEALKVAPKEDGS